ncbi:hypothetical protein HK103_007340 [Boothiomyces macroporosus]|uniref:AraC effector-binding domain-containing protein n=1 Tax=Boothiomyces macroporosus TaxID=261099 RepID=A0AAD5UQ36_9FUNG|nr:hypothetical protein HK103_007340 [Boothiomyces macroporosus]
MTARLVKTEQDGYALVSRQVVKDFRFDLAFKQGEECLAPFIKKLNPKLTTAMAFSPSDPKMPGDCYYEPGYLITNPNAVKDGLAAYSGEGKDTLHVRKINAGEWLVFKHVGAYNTLNASWEKAKAEILKAGKQLNCTMDSLPYELYLNDMSNTPVDQLVTEIWLPIQ